jgi:hypothetical protein
MSERHMIGILTAILCSQYSCEQGEVGDLDNVVARAMTLARRGMGRIKAIDAIDTITSGSPAGAKILRAVDAAVAFREATSFKSCGSAERFKWPITHREQKK